MHPVALSQVAFSYGNFPMSFNDKSLEDLIVFPEKDNPKISVLLINEGKEFGSLSHAKTMQKVLERIKTLNDAGFYVLPVLDGRSSSTYTLKDCDEDQVNRIEDKLSKVIDSGEAVAKIQKAQFDRQGTGNLTQCARLKILCTTY